MFVFWGELRAPKLFSRFADQIETEPQNRNLTLFRIRLVRLIAALLGYANYKMSFPDTYAS